MITFDLDVVQVVQLFVLPVLLPLLVGLVTTRVTSPNRKSVLLLALSVITALVTELINAVSAGDPYNLGMGLFMAFVTFVSGVALHYGLFKPTGVSEKVADAGVTTKPVDGDEDVDFS